MTQDFFMSSKMFDELRKEISKIKVISCLIQKDSKKIFEYYKNPKAKTNLQKINSCTKSFTSALVGICWDKGLLDVHTPISEYFSDILIKEQDYRKQKITIEHLLTMSAGFDWPEFEEWNYFSPMIYSPDIVKFILKRELKTNPGEKMNYNSGCTHLLGAIIQQVVGNKVDDFAQEVLFSPLGITEYKWYEIQGQSLTADGLRLKADDMIKLGTLYLNQGKYLGNQIISQDWILKSTKTYYNTYNNIGGYAYQWWTSEIKVSDDKIIAFYFALGYMGQYICIVPDLKMTIAIVSRLDNTLYLLNIIKKFIVQINQ